MCPVTGFLLCGKNTTGAVQMIEGEETIITERVGDSPARFLYCAGRDWKTLKKYYGLIVITLILPFDMQIDT